MICDIDRFGHGLDSTLSRFVVPEFGRAYVLEDEYRTTKVHAETRIDCGLYKVELRTEGGMHERYLDRFPDIHKGMLWLRNVPNFKWIQMHCGNDDDDTAGCPLIGTIPVILPNGEFEILQSGAAYRRFYPFLAEYAAIGDLYFNIQNRLVA